MTLKQLRNSIDNIDQQLVALLAKRAEAAQAIGHAKGQGLKFSPAREAEVIHSIRSANNGPLSNEALEAIFREIIASCLNLEQVLRVSYLGPAGTYSEEAARKRFGAMAQLVPQATLDEVLQQVEAGGANVAVLPIENSTEGAVNRTLDLLLGTNKQIVGEIVLPIHHQLLTLASDLQSVTEVAAHPQALAQCRAWLSRHLPHARQVGTDSNAEAAKLAFKRPEMAAIAGKQASLAYGMPIAARNIEDERSNTTRFVVVGPNATTPTGSDKTSLVCSVPNVPGSLAKLITIIAGAGVNMTKLESRPSLSGLWDYVFYIDLDGHAEDTRLGDVIAELREQTQFVKILGSYPKATS